MTIAGRRVISKRECDIKAHIDRARDWEHRLQERKALEGMLTDLSWNLSTTMTFHTRTLQTIMSMHTIL